MPGHDLDAPGERRPGRAGRREQALERPRGWRHRPRPARARPSAAPAPAAPGHQSTRLDPSTTARRGARRAKRSHPGVARRASSAPKSPRQRPRRASREVAGQLGGQPVRRADARAGRRSFLLLVGEALRILVGADDVGDDLEHAAPAARAGPRLADRRRRARRRDPDARRRRGSRPPAPRRRRASPPARATAALRSARIDDRMRPAARVLRLAEVDERPRRRRRRWRRASSQSVPPVKRPEHAARPVRGRGPSAGRRSAGASAERPDAAERRRLERLDHAHAGRRVAAPAGQVGHDGLPRGGRRPPARARATARRRRLRHEPDHARARVRAEPAERLRASRARRPPRGGRARRCRCPARLPPPRPWIRLDTSWSPVPDAATSPTCPRRTRFAKPRPTPLTRLVPHSGPITRSPRAAARRLRSDSSASGTPSLKRNTWRPAESAWWASAAAWAPGTETNAMLAAVRRGGAHERARRPASWAPWSSVAARGEERLGLGEGGAPPRPRSPRGPRRRDRRPGAPSASRGNSPASRSVARLAGVPIRTAAAAVPEGAAAPRRSASARRSLGTTRGERTPSRARPEYRKPRRRRSTETGAA